MPVHSGTIRRTSDVVADIDRDSISPISLDSRTGELPINKDSAAIHAVGSDEATSDIEVVATSDACVIS